MEHGCLLVIPGSHRHRGEAPIRHVIDAPGESNTIPTSELAPGSPVPLPVRRGGLVLFDRLIRHVSLPNWSVGIRMSFDQRCQPAGRPFLPLSRGAGRASPGSVLQDAKAWAGLWEAAGRMVGVTCGCGPVRRVIAPIERRP